MNQHLHAVAGYIQLHRNDSEGLLLLLQRQLLPGSPEYDAVVELLSEMARVKEEARLAAEAQEKKVRHETDERRFQTQLTETRNQFRIAQGIAFLAVAISILGWIFPRAAHETSPTSAAVLPSPQSLTSNTPTILLPVLTNSLTTTTTNQVRP
jgi:hypothetical protein